MNATTTVARTCITTSYGKVRGKAKQYPYFQPAIYDEHVRIDGTRVWRYRCHTGTARRSADLARKDAQAIAAESGLPYLSGVRQWTPITTTEPL